MRYRQTDAKQMSIVVCAQLRLWLNLGNYYHRHLKELIVRIHLFLILLVSFSLFSSAIFAQVIYSWTDKNGSAKFSDKVPVNVDPGDLIKINVRTNSSFKTVKQIAK